MNGQVDKFPCLMVDIGGCFSFLSFFMCGGMLKQKVGEVLRLNNNKKFFGF